MGFFGKLFDKKECAICGGEIGLLGNRKLEDGNMCKKCAAKLSPWFSDRRNSTVQEIEAQLQYREENQMRLNGFRESKRFGDNYMMFVEEIEGVPKRFIVSRNEDYRDANADIIEFKDVSFCKIDIREDCTELEYKNNENESVKYDPPRYEYHYDFFVEMGIADNPYFDEISFRLNNSAIDVSTEDYGRHRGFGIGQFRLSAGEFNPEFNTEYSRFKKMCDEIEEITEAGRNGKAVVKFEDAVLGMLGKLAEQHSAEAAPEQEAPRAKFCANCGSPASGGKFCQNCGSPL